MPPGMIASSELGGITRVLPVSVFAIGLAGISLVGLPPSAGFVGKWLLLGASLEQGQWWWVAVILVGSLLAAAYVVRLLSHAFIRSAGTAAAWKRVAAGDGVVGLCHRPGSPFALGFAADRPGAAAEGVLSWRRRPMNAGAALLLGILLSSFITGCIIFFLREESHRLRTWLNLAGAVLKLVPGDRAARGVYCRASSCEWSITMAPGIDFALGADAISVLFVTLSTVLWLLTTLYAIGYLEGSPHRSRFFGFFSLCVSATIGHRAGREPAHLPRLLRAAHGLDLPAGGSSGDRGVHAGGQGLSCLHPRGGRGAAAGGGLAAEHSRAGLFHRSAAPCPIVAAEHPSELQVLFVLFIAGLGVKAALVPLHGWLPQAMVAPAPGELAAPRGGGGQGRRLRTRTPGLRRLRHRDGAVTSACSPRSPWLAALTIVYGSVRALFQDELKKRLAYSTVSQVSYIILGTAIFGPMATTGGIVHLVHQGIMKITLFFGAGNYAETLGVHRVSEMNGVGRRMPWTTAAFTVGALGMIGVPPLAGYISKYYLQTGRGASAGGLGIPGPGRQQSVQRGLLPARSSTAPGSCPPPDTWPREHSFGRWETAWMLLVPPLFTAAW